MNCSCGGAIRDAGGSAESVVLDVLDLAAVLIFCASRPAFQVLINSAGTNGPMPIWQVTEADYNAVLDLNLKSAFFLAQACALQMMEQGVPGSLIHIGSQMGHDGGPQRSPYCASKWALEEMNKAMALDLAPYSIRLNTIAPTFIETPLKKPFLDDPDFSGTVMRGIKLGRLGQFEDLMGAVVFLAGDQSALMTGASIVVDGGWAAD